MKDNPMMNAIRSQLPRTDDLERTELQKDGWNLVVYRLSCLCDENLVRQTVLEPFLSSETLQDFQLSLETVGAQPADPLGDVRSPLFEGYVLIAFGSSLYFMSALKSMNEQPGDLKIESTVLGPQKALCEDLSLNLYAIRTRYPKPELKVDMYRIGEVSNTQVAMLYDTSIVDQAILSKVKAKLRKVKIDVLQAAGQLETLMNNRRHTLFPTMLITERPDRIVLNLSQGKMVLIVAGSPFALILPAVFFDFMSAMDDIYQTFWVTRTLLILRYISLLLTITLPALYISIISYTPEITRVQLTMSIAGSRAAVPYPSYVEVLIMLFMIEALVEASLRLPKYIGSTATTVGGLILGQAAQQAGLVSSIMIIITSVVAISNFVIPINTMSFAMRAVKYVLIILASAFGIIGATVGLFMLIAYLTKLRSFGLPYLKVYVEEPRAGRRKSQAGDTG
ncbi:spore germination protein [Paenibacillus filicis]|uniref:Spore germination protein n=1 Tax=Paenibacillus gyeongsangnamensis TaxID=3388067 RepID=A0ABT4QFU1_9BACL|nr:spore germination protein [Paenibacillus filicis]MCZ8515757.1 spore germination protein [Paenibacillus filicis]